MKIKRVYCKQFKRFTDLTITGIPATAKLVCLVGPNGCGKSSLFEVFNYAIHPSKHGSFTIDPDYHIKALPEQNIDQSNYSKLWGSGFSNISIDFHDAPSVGPGQNPKKETFYIRSSYRHEAEVNVDHFSRLNDILLDESRPPKVISTDQRVRDNYSRIVGDSIGAIFSEQIPDTATKLEIRARLIGRIRTAVRNLFPDLTFEGVGNPVEKGTFYFSKGAIKKWKYLNLSAGEKAAFDLILDLVIKTEAFRDTVFCIDEPELHMHSQLQSRLLDELYRNIPGTCQLWIATHSIGMLRKARELGEKEPGAVIFLDFADKDFDAVAQIVPAQPDRNFWKKTFSVAIGDLAELVAPSTIIFCEGSQSAMTGSRPGEFDAQCFRTIFSKEFPDVEFVSLGSASEVEKNALLLTSVLQRLVAGIKLAKVVDRDDRSTREVEELKAKGTHVLSRRQIESFLFDDEILTKLCASVGQADKASAAIAAKQAALNASNARGNPADDYKSMAPQLCSELKKLLGLTQAGNSKDAFCVDTLVPLITAETAIYQALRVDVIP